MYYAGTGTLPWSVIVAALIYALLPTTVLMGKHIDKLPYDAPAGTRTLPVLLGEGRAKAVTQGMMIAFYVGIVALVAVRALPWPALLIVLAVPRLVRTLKAFNQPRPTEPPRRESGVATVVGAARVPAHPARRRPAHRRPAALAALAGRRLTPAPASGHNFGEVVAIGRHNYRVVVAVAGG